MRPDEKTVEAMKEKRLQDYRLKAFCLEMDLAALKAIGDTDNIEIVNKQLEVLKTAYEAVESLK